MAKALTGVSTISATKIAPVHADAPTRAAAVQGEERHVIRGAPWDFTFDPTKSFGGWSTKTQATASPGGRVWRSGCGPN
jgi:hypothetical protein